MTFMEPQMSKVSVIYAWFIRLSPTQNASFPTENLIRVRDDSVNSTRPWKGSEWIVTGKKHDQTATLGHIRRKNEVGMGGDKQRERDM